MGSARARSDVIAVFLSTTFSVTFKAFRDYEVSLIRLSRPNAPRNEFWGRNYARLEV